MIEIGHIRDDDPMGRLIVQEQVQGLVDDMDAAAEAEAEAKRQQEDTLHRRLWGFFEDERDRQRHNRFQMALDEDYFDSLQWTDEEIDDLIRRGQAPTVYNLIKPTILWLIGTEVRTRMDHKVAPREPNDDKNAEVKTKYIKYLDDVNREKWSRSRAFQEAAIAGLSWLEVQASTHPRKEKVVTGWEWWKNVLRDSLSRKPDLEDGRYLFRQKMVDLDVAQMMFPDRKEELAQAASHSTTEANDDWYLGERLVKDDWPGARDINKFRAIDQFSQFRTGRKRVLLVEGWYRVPVEAEVVVGGPMHGSVFNPDDPWMAFNQRMGTIKTAKQFTMQMHHCFMTEKGMLLNEVSQYRHNDFPLTPIWAYRRGRDGEPYGAVRELRSPQDDLNKRMSKAIWRTSSNQIIMENGAVEDIDEAREEASRPDGVIITKTGKRFEIREQQPLASGDIELVQIDINMIERMGPVNGDNLGAESQAQSGRAIRFRQEQGSIMSQLLFDNLRLAVQIHGEKKLSVSEQFVTEEKVIRITEEKGKFQWEPINQPQENADGSITYLNDMLETKGDFVLDEQDFRATVREAMIESLSNVMSGLQPDLGASLLPSLLELQDLPDKENILAKVKAKLGMLDEDDPAQQRIKDMEAQFQQEIEGLKESYEKELKRVNDELQAQDDRNEALERQLMTAQGRAIKADIRATTAAATSQIKDRERAASNAAQTRQLDLQEQAAAREDARFEREGQQGEAEEASGEEDVKAALVAMAKALQDMEKRLNALQPTEG